MSTRHRSDRNRRSRGKRSLHPLLENLEIRLTMTVGPHLNLLEFHDPSGIPSGLTPSAMGIVPQVNGLSLPAGYRMDLAKELLNYR